MKTHIALSMIALLLGAANVEASPLATASNGHTLFANSASFHWVSQRTSRTVKPSRLQGAHQNRPASQGPAGAGAMAGSGGTVQDTCNSTDPWGLCEIDDFVARCDAAGGGLSTQPGGGIDCDTSGWE